MNTTIPFIPEARDFAGTAFVNLKNALPPTDPFVRHERLLVARKDLEAAGETLAADLVLEVIIGHAYVGYIVPVILANLKKKYNFLEPVK